ncbi:MAG: CCA tRNA nucleotidyltransferase [bacterium]
MAIVSSPNPPLFDLAQPPLAEAFAVVRALHGAGHQALFAGGCVRDALLGRAVKDIDIATRATPEEVERLFPGATVAVGKAFGVIVVLRGTQSFEVATFRADGNYTDGRRPDDIRFTDAAEDARRRDFTINGLFYDPVSSQVLDFVNGREDLAAGLVRAIGDPAARFREDHLRLLRAVRFTAVLGFRLDPATAAAARAAAPLLADVSAERIGVEFTRMLCEARRASQLLEMLENLGLLQIFLPEVAAMQGVEQPAAYHPEGDVWTHTCLMLDAIPLPRDPALAYAALLHDVGKPSTLARGPGDVPRFPSHAPVGAEMARGILQRLKRPNELIDPVVIAVERHMTFSALPDMRPAKLRRFLGAPTFPLELALHLLDVDQSHGKREIAEFAKNKLAEFASETVLPQPWVRGRDLLALGLPPGPAVGQWVTRAYDAQLEGRFPDRNALLAWVKQELPAGN